MVGKKISQVVQWRQGKEEKHTLGRVNGEVRHGMEILSACNEFLVACGIQAESSVSVISVGCKRRHDKARVD